MVDETWYLLVLRLFPSHIATYSASPTVISRSLDSAGNMWLTISSGVPLIAQYP